MSAILEISPIKFSCVSEAVVWSERTLLRTGLGSQMTGIVLKGGYQEENPNPSSDISGEDRRDIAHTISCKVSHIEPHAAGQMYRFMCGYNDMKAVFQLTADLEIAIKQQIHAPNRQIKKIKNLALLILMAERKLKMHNQPTSASSMARNFGMSRSAFYLKPWPQARKVANEIITSNVDAAELQLGEMLGEIGVL